MLYQKKHEQSIEKARAAQLENEKFDVKTGKELFRPQILKTPHNDRDRNIWEELYSHKKKPISFNTPSVRLIDKNSEKITERIRYRRYNEIFQSLSPINGIIRYVTIDFKIVDIQNVCIIYGMEIHRTKISLFLISIVGLIYWCMYLNNLCY